MGKFSGYLLLSDMDGTLLDEKEKRVSEKNREAIEYFVREGGLFTFASGRSRESVRRYVDAVPLNAPVILLNGAIIYDYKKEEMIYHKPLNNEIALEIMNAAVKEFPEIGVEIHTASEMVVVRNNEYTDRHAKVSGLPLSIRPPEEIGLPWYKILFTHENSFLKEVEHFLAERKVKTSTVRFVYSEAFYYEMIASGISKGTGLRFLSEYLGIEKEKVAAVGDNHNDVELLHEAGISFAVENSVDEIKSICDHLVCSCDMDAISGVIERLDQMI